jgi:hypothetical protein
MSKQRVTKADFRDVYVNLIANSAFGNKNVELRCILGELFNVKIEANQLWERYQTAIF